MIANTHGPEQEVRQRILSQGPITFAEFHRIALYWPRGGYYNGAGPFGAAGDFYTAPLAHPAFGALLMVQLRHMWQILGEPNPFWIIEPGAGVGRMAEDILRAAEAFAPEMYETLRYVAIEPHPASCAPGPLQWLRSAGLPLRGVRGCILANELLDAFPVHRVHMRNGELREIFVTLDEAGTLVELDGEPSTPALAERFEALNITLPNDYRTEVNLELRPWLEAAAAALGSGYLLLFDYGHEARDFYGAARASGTLRCYYRHTLNANPLRHVGKQDISVHVEFSSVRNIAVSLGLVEMGFALQAEFLANLGLDDFRKDIEQRRGLPSQVRDANLWAMDTLVREDGMGSFKVAAFGKSVPQHPLQGFSPGLKSQERVAAPLTTPAHMPAPDFGPSEMELPSWEELLR